VFLRPVLAAAALATVAGMMTAVPAGSAATGNVVTPGSFRGYGFDQCLAPSRSAMNAWLRHSPFLAVGIYISGASRACRDQPHLTPDWIGTQLRHGWRLLPITLGPQAPCNPRFPRYGNDPVIRNDPGPNKNYGKARQQGATEAGRAVAAAQRLGISAGSTLWYDLEGFDQTNSRCRKASLAFLSGWTRGIHSLHYVSGVYSSAGSGIWALDRARVDTPDLYRLPDQIWIARWDGLANTSTSYIAEDGWRPGGRVKQYVGGHDETWGGVRINIDRDFLSLGKPAARAEQHCGGVDVDLSDYPRAKAGADPVLVRALQCLLTEQQVYGGRLSGAYNAKTLAAAQAWQRSHGLPVRATFNRRSWMSLLAAGPRPVLKNGSTGSAVRRAQRVLNAATPSTGLAVTGVFNARTDAAVRAWQKAVGRKAEGVVNPGTWTAFAAGTRD
jgi:peptidoglycan hydrolase-like protein with peptidoglycan-binding domain